MATRTCPAGKKWDDLVRSCVKVRTPKARATTAPHTVSTRAQPRTPVPATSAFAWTTAQAPLEVPPSLALWLVVLLTTLGSVLALLLWLIICRRRGKFQSALEAVEPAQEPLEKTANGGRDHPAPPLQGHTATQQREAAATAGGGGRGGGEPSPCPQLHYGAQEDPEQEESFISCWDPTLHGGAGEGGGLPARSPLREHRIPLPATELGGTALVTTKTM